jgi:hypothetical protein
LPASPQFFPVTLTDAATGLLVEICYCTLRTTDALTVTRAEEGTDAQSWLIGDFARNQITAAVLSGVIGLENSAAYTAPLLAAGAQGAIQTVGFVGATVGGFVQASFSVDLAGLSLRAWVASAGVVKFVFANPTSASVALGAGTVTLRVTPT